MKTNRANQAKVHFVYFVHRDQPGIIVDVMVVTTTISAIIFTKAFTRLLHTQTRYRKQAINKMHHAIHQLNHHSLFLHVTAGKFVFLTTKGQRRL